MAEEWEIFLADYLDGLPHQIVLRNKENRHLAILWQDWCGRTGPIAYEYLTTHGMIGDEFEPWRASEEGKDEWIGKILEMESLEIPPEMRLYTMEEFNGASREAKANMWYILDSDGHVYFEGNKNRRCG